MTAYLISGTTEIIANVFQTNIGTTCVVDFEMHMYMYIQIISHYTALITFTRDAFSVFADRMVRGVVLHDDAIKWKHFPRYWSFVRGIHRSPVNSPHKGQWRRALMFSLIFAWINGWVNNRKAGDLRRNRAHYDVSVMENGLWGPRWSDRYAIYLTPVPSIYVTPASDIYSVSGDIYG